MVEEGGADARDEALRVVVSTAHHRVALAARRLPVGTDLYPEAGGLHRESVRAKQIRRTSFTDPGTSNVASISWSVEEFPPRTFDEQAHVVRRGEDVR